VLYLDEKVHMMFTPTTRASLLLRLRDSQDHEAWVDFVKLYEPIVYRLFRKNGLQDADARELMQDLFLAVSRNIDRWHLAKERGSFGGWLRKVVRNLTIDWLKSSQRKEITGYTIESEKAVELVPSVDDPQTIEFDLELRRALFQKAADLVRNEVKLNTWQAFWDTSVNGAGVEDVAKALGMTAGAVRVAKCRVIARMQKIVRNLENET
jgi:RNA polymerase sigma factor (sigma-70 family)